MMKVTLFISFSLQTTATKIARSARVRRWLPERLVEEPVLARLAAVAPQSQRAQHEAQEARLEPLHGRGAAPRAAMRLRLAPRHRPSALEQLLLHALGLAPIGDAIGNCDHGRQLAHT